MLTLVSSVARREPVHIKVVVEGLSECLHDMNCVWMIVIDELGLLAIHTHPLEVARSTVGQHKCLDPPRVWFSIPHQVVDYDNIVCSYVLYHHCMMWSSATPTI